MGKTFYTCPLCNKQSGYISEYGMQDSVICKCQGLKEVGRLVNGVYQPIKATNPSTGVLSNGQPIPRPKELIDVIINNPPYGNGGMGPVLPQGKGNGQRVVTAQSIGIQTTNFMIYQLAKENEVEAAGVYFNNALKSSPGRKQYMQMGDIYYAEHSDESRSLMFYVDKITKEAVNFYAKSNASGQLSDIDEIKVALRNSGLIKN